MRSGAEGQERILETSLVQKCDFMLKHGDGTLGQEELHWGCEQGLVIYYGVGGGKVKRKFLTDYWRPSCCQAKVVFPSSKALTSRQWGVPGL